MRYSEIENTKESIFKRLTGVKRRIFEEMISVVDDYKVSWRKHKSKGRPRKLSIADKLLMLLMYYREYRTFLHISVCYGVS
jgi:Helix-turn-helix of DDE superfamily endonuclease